ncbi:MAG: sec-independent protein translocase protein TatA [Streptosporangiaceae bacterium]|jgi:sec-independent protein translocase protein TatA|nr:preprotein translocase subunit TatA [Streptosporangiaceae bacterium]MDX6433145.1 sec-independent protein translocase protein TatA [Streptosporangiaceae bacterium]
MGELSPWHWLIVAAVFLVLFGSKKMPDAARSLGRSLRIFKSEISDLTSDNETPAAALPVAQAPDGRSGDAPAAVAAAAAPASPPADPGRSA